MDRDPATAAVTLGPDIRKVDYDIVKIVVDATSTRSYKNSLSDGKIEFSRGHSNRKRARLMNLAIQIVRHTPIWVFPVVAGVLWLGSINLRERAMPLRLLFVLPVVMLVLSVGNSIGTAAEPLFVLIDWFFSAAAGATIGWKLTQAPRMVDRRLGG